MRRVMLLVAGLLLLAAAAYLTLRLVGDRELVILASVAPAIVAAGALGTILILRAVRPA
jgi:hypothetical protein